MTKLRRVERDDVGYLETQYNGPDEAGLESWFGFRDPGRLGRRLDAGETITEERGSLAVTDDDGSLVGELSWIRVFNGPPPNGGCWNVGIWIGPEHRGKGHGTAAQRLGAAYLFEHTTMQRVEASTEADNVAEQKALEKAGFAREGVLRQACFRGGAWRDMVIYSKLRGEE
jgi:RimJ/RimL family protein N-acetyltransferase